jgi:hypothetical protein
METSQWNEMTARAAAEEYVFRFLATAQVVAAAF